FELLLCHRMSLQGQECGDLILISAKSSIYSTKPFTGYQITPWLAAEGGYDYLGNMQLNGKQGAPGARMKSQGLQLSLKASYGLTDSWDIYTRAGAMGYRAESDSRGHNKFETGVRPLVAVGTEYAFTPALAGRLEYQWVSNVGNTNQIGVSADASSLTAGVVYRFGQHDNAPAPAPAPVAAPATVAPKTFNLKSDVMFAWDSATLTTEGKAAITRLYNSPELQAARNHSTTVIGYTDRMGDAAYNQALSARRAQTVADQLVALGMSPSQVTTEGRGSRDSVTGGSCDYLNSHALVKCLAPDRRVLVQISGQ
ncbi:porin OmpA, partial [Shimwellia pseudoproteus]|uniref:porin OmpA n=1 Tax=Shimwellia pseudoproteus TaxID=570012 RepID=UPI0018EAC574